MKSKYLSEKIREEGVYIVMAFVIFIIMFKIVFYKESMITIIKTIFSLFYLIILPGYCVMIYWIDRIDFSERLVLGVVAGTVVIGLFSYYAGILGLNVKYHFIPLPLAVIVLCVLFNLIFVR